MGLCLSHVIKCELFGTDLGLNMDNIFFKVKSAPLILILVAFG